MKAINTTGQMIAMGEIPIALIATTSFDDDIRPRTIQVENNAVPGIAKQSALGNT